MQVLDGRVWLSPSDVTAYLACEHLTALQLQVAEGEFAKPRRPATRPSSSSARGSSTSRVPRAPARAGSSSVDLDRVRRRLGAAPRGDARGDARRRRRRLPGRLHRGRLARSRRLPDQGRAPSELGAWSYEALDTKLARTRSPPTSCSSASTASSSLSCRAGAGADPRAARAPASRSRSGPQEFAAYYRRIERPARGLRRRSAADRAVPVDHCGICELQARLRRALGRGRPPLSGRRASSGAQIERLAAAGIDDARRARRARPTSRRRPGSPTRRSRSSVSRPSCSSPRASTASDSYGSCRPQAGAGFALLPDPSPGDLFFDFEGNPFWDSSGGLEYLWGSSTSSATSAAARARPRRPSARRSRRSSTWCTSGSREFPDLHVYHYAQYEITALRRLMGRYGTREAELDDLLRRERLRRPLHVVRNGSGSRGRATG